MTTSAERKASPVYSGVMAYFPRALMAISRVSRAGNEKHNPGEPLHWSKDKSVDQPDCVARHNLTPYQVDEDSGERHFVHAAWRQLAWVELCFEAVELGLVTWDQLDRGEIAAEQLGKMIVQRRAVKEITQIADPAEQHLADYQKCAYVLDVHGALVDSATKRTT